MYRIDSGREWSSMSRGESEHTELSGHAPHACATVLWGWCFTKQGSSMDAAVAKAHFIE